MSKTASYSAREEAIRLGVLLSCLCLAIIYGDWSWRWDRLIYDTQASMIQHKASDDIIIVAIDEASLRTIGRWPWPRSIHSQLINQLSQHGAKAIVFDVVFSEPSMDQQQDDLLATALQNNGKVVLPVILEQTRLGGYLLESLPIPRLSKHAAAIGHVHIELDPDGIARSTFIYEGLGQAHWPHIGLATLNMLNESHHSWSAELSAEDDNPWAWRRKHQVYIPFVGPPGSFNTTSYINVLNNEILTNTVKDKIVLVGVTAAGLGDALPTPVSGLSHPMPGIEINANIIQALQSNSLIHPVERVWLFVISAVLVFLPVFLFSYLTPRSALMLIVIELAIIFLISLSLLHSLHLWVPFSAVIICLLLAYPLWAWRRLEFMVKYLNDELNTLSKETRELQQFASQDKDLPFEYLQTMVPITALSVYAENNQLMFSFGKRINNMPMQLSSALWTAVADGQYGRMVFVDNSNTRCFIHWKPSATPEEAQTKIIKTYIRQLTLPGRLSQATSTVEIIESRINDIRSITDKLAYLRQFVTDSLEQMADGVIVIDKLGVVTLTNPQALRLLSSSKHNQLLHKPILPILENISISSGESWQTIIHAVLSDKHYENLQVRIASNKDLVVNISPLHDPKGITMGFVISLSDITAIKDAQRKRNEMLSFLSHDFRSPLVSVLALLEQSKHSDKQSDIQQRINKNINQTIQLAEDFVHLSRVESDDDIHFSSLNLSDVIANAIDTVWDQAKVKNISIQQQLSEDAWISGNGSILERVFINLLTNAIKYCEPGSHVWLTMEKKNDTIICQLKDDGPGIDEDELAHLFDRFSRSKRHHANTGTGLGLAFVHAAIERHGGSINVDSQLGKGACFTIKLAEDRE